MQGGPTKTNIQGEGSTSERPALRVPEVRADVDRGAELRPKRVEEWLASLPLTDPVEAAGQIGRALFAQNRVPLDPENRLELMELYREPVSVVRSGLQAMYAGQAFPLSPKHAALVELQFRLDIEMSAGYKQVIAAVLGEPALPKGFPLAMAVARAVEALGRVLSGVYMAYMPMPRGVWREINQLYFFAEKRGFADQPVKENTGASSAQSSVSDAYKKVVLLGACNPYGLQQGECRRVEEFLGRWSLKVTIRRELEAARPAGHFLVGSEADTPPIPYTKIERRVDGDHLRVVDAIELVRDVHELLKRLERGESPKEIGLCEDNCVGSVYVDLLRHLGRLWGLSIRRQSRRAPRKGPVSVCVGLQASHYFISGRHPFNPPVVAGPSQEQLVEAWADAAPASAYVDLDEIEQPSGAAGQGAVAETTGTWKRDTPAPFKTEFWQTEDEYQVYQWETKDESAGGVALMRHGEFDIRVRVGDLVALRFEEGDSWRVGVIRWLRTESADSAEIGVQLLAPDVRPAAIRRSPSDVDPHPGFEPALLLPANAALHRPEMLVVGRGLHRAGSRLTLAIAENEAREVQAVQVVDSTGSVVQLAFAPLAERAGPD
jgi:hypothetical protein